MPRHWNPTSFQIFVDIFWGWKQAIFQKKFSEIDHCVTVYSKKANTQKKKSSRTMPRHWNPTSFQIFVEWFIGARCFSSMMIIWYCKMAKCGQKCILPLRPALRTVHSRPRLKFLFRNLTNYMVLLFVWSGVGAFCKMFLLGSSDIARCQNVDKNAFSCCAPCTLRSVHNMT